MEINIVSNKKKILLVEDSRLTALIAVKSLQSSGYDVETAATGEEAVQKASGASPPDLVLMDIELAGKMDGIEAARRILKTRDIPVVQKKEILSATQVTSDKLVLPKRIYLKLSYI